MKKALLIFAGLAFLASCSNKTQLTGDLTGQWYIYKITRNNIDQSHLLTDSFLYYNITFTSDGKYIEQNVFGIDTTNQAGTWTFLNNNGQVQFTDSAQNKKVYTIFNLVGNHVELLRNTEDRYMRKFQ